MPIFRGSRFFLVVWVHHFNHILSYQLHIPPLLILPALQSETLLLAFRACHTQTGILDVKSRRGLPCSAKAAQAEMRHNLVGDKQYW